MYLEKFRARNTATHQVVFKSLLYTEHSVALTLSLAREIHHDIHICIHVIRCPFITKLYNNINSLSKKKTLEHLVSGRCCITSFLFTLTNTRKIKFSSTNKLTNFWLKIQTYCHFHSKTISLFLKQGLSKSTFKIISIICKFLSDLAVTHFLP